MMLSQCKFTTVADLPDVKMSLSSENVARRVLVTNARQSPDLLRPAVSLSVMWHTSEIDWRVLSGWQCEELAPTNNKRKSEKHKA